MTALTSEAGLERLDIPQDIARSTLLNQRLRGETVEEHDSIIEVPRGGRLQVASQQRGAANHRQCVVKTSRRHGGTVPASHPNVAPQGMSGQQALRQRPGASAKMARSTFLEIAEPSS